MNDGLLTSEESAACPVCGGELTFCYGFAGGGLGPYTMCLDCDRIITKERKDPGECFHFPGDDEGAPE